MIPRIDLDTFIDVPDGTLWLPDFEDLDEDGFGFFRDAWLLLDVTADEVSAVRGQEKDFLREADDQSRQADEFDLLCRQMEHPEDDFEDGLGGLEIGVSGFSYALNLVGAATAASCRGHVGPTAWSSCPVVYLAAEGPWIRLLTDLVEQQGCGLALSEDRLLMIWGPSVVETVGLADTLWSQRDRFQNLGPSAFQR